MGVSDIKKWQVRITNFDFGVWDDARKILRGNCARKLPAC